MDECVFTPCSNGGTCQNTLGSYLCNCPAGWIGKHCDVGKDRNFIKNLCIQMHVHLICLRLLYYNIWTFLSKYWVFFADVDECVNFPCQRSGICLNINGSYMCKCPDGWEGQNCEFGKRKLIQKKKNKTHAWFLCYKMTNFWHVYLLHGSKKFKSIYMILIFYSLDINECKSNPCQNGGFCENTNGFYQCRCADGWMGQNCQIGRFCPQIYTSNAKNNCLTM